MLSRGRPELAIRRADGRVWRDAAGLGWTNPYDRRVWKYNVDIAVAAARAGFDEIMFDYVRFPSDGSVGDAVYRNRGSLRKREAVPAFLRYAKQRLAPYGVRVSAAVFGLSAARDLGIGQLPRRMAPYLDTVYAMTYPSLFGPGELGLADPGSTPGATVVSSASPLPARPAREQCAARAVGAGLELLRARTGSTQVRAQIDAARISGAKGYMLWNAEGLYTDGASRRPVAEAHGARRSRRQTVCGRARSGRGRGGGSRGAPELDALGDDAVAAPERRQAGRRRRRTALRPRRRGRRARPAPRAAPTGATPTRRSGCRAAGSPSTRATPPPTAPRPGLRRAPDVRAPTSARRPRRADSRGARRPFSSRGS